MKNQAEGLAITGGKGFHITFSNGWTVSVQFGPYNYCEHNSTPRRDFEARVGDDWSSATAEVAVWDSENNWMEFDGDTVAGYKTPDEVAALITRIARKKPKVAA